MRKAILFALFLGAFGCTAHAQGVATQSVSLTATVGGYCTIDGTSTGAQRSAVVPVANGVVTPGTLTLTGNSGSVICTSNATIQLTTMSGGLTNSAGSASAPFTNKIHYTASASYNGKVASIDTSAATAGTPTAGVTTVGGPQTNSPLDLSVNITATPGGKYLSNGTFTDTLVVTLSPSP